METREIILTLMEAADQLRIFHWQTKCYAEHVALGDLYNAVSDASDDFAEALIGAEDGNRPTLKDTIQIIDYVKDGPAHYIKAFAQELESLTTQPTDVLNIRDDLLAKCHKTLYLLSLNEEEEEEEDEPPTPAANPTE